MKNPIEIQNIDHIVIRAKNIERMISFYRDILGCPMEKQNINLGLYQLRAGTSLIDLVAVDSKLGKVGGAAPSDEGHNMDHVCLCIINFNQEALCHYFTEHNIEFGEFDQRYGATGKGPSVYIKDPEGNTVELKGTLHKTLHRE